MTKAKVLKEAAKHNATLDIDDGYDVFHVTLDTPHGRVWNANFGHSVVAWVYKPFKRATVWASLLADMDGGTTECTDTNCEVCNDV